MSSGSLPELCARLRLVLGAHREPESESCDDSDFHPVHKLGSGRVDSGERRSAGLLMCSALAVAVGCWCRSSRLLAVRT